MAAFWDKIKSVAKGIDEKKDQEQKESTSKKDSATPVAPPSVSASSFAKVSPSAKASEDKSKDKPEDKSKDTGVKAEKEKDPTSSKDKPKDVDTKAKEKEPKKSKKAKKKMKKRDMKSHEAQLVNKILVLPKVSEAAMNQQALGKYVFEVSKNSTKSEIAHVVEMMYGVSVRKVNTVCYKSKSHGFKGVSGMKSGYKKAIVSLKQGDSIELFKESK